MIVGGPNERTDYHYDEGPEYFYQLEGEMVLRLMEADGPRDVPLRAGQMFLLPPRVPHSPQRMAGSVGLVIERKRLAGEQDGLMWFCPQCHHKLYESYFVLTDIETQFGAVFDKFYGSEMLRTCSRCATVHPCPPPKH
jgi:3-hydroxyanthranilate 3,4-dioxygenase